MSLRYIPAANYEADLSSPLSSVSFGLPIQTFRGWPTRGAPEETSLRTQVRARVSSRKRDTFLARRDAPELPSAAGPRAAGEKRNRGRHRSRPDDADTIAAFRDTGRWPSASARQRRTLASVSLAAENPGT